MVNYQLLDERIIYGKKYYLIQAYKRHLYPSYLTSYDLKKGGENFGLQSGLHDALKFESESKAKEWTDYASQIFKEREWEIVPVDERLFGKVTPLYIL